MSGRSEAIRRLKEIDGSWYRLVSRPSWADSCDAPGCDAEPTWANAKAREVVEKLSALGGSTELNAAACDAHYREARARARGALCGLGVKPKRAGMVDPDEPEEVTYIDGEAPSGPGDDAEE